MQWDVPTEGFGFIVATEITVLWWSVILFHHNMKIQQNFNNRDQITLHQNSHVV
jgi:hypothetical protein